MQALVRGHWEPGWHYNPWRGHRGGARPRIWSMRSLRRQRPALDSADDASRRAASLVLLLAALTTLANWAYLIIVALR